MSNQPVAEKLDALATDAEASRMAATDPTLGRIHLHMRAAYQHAASLVRAAQLAAPVQQDAMLWRALVAIPPADIAEIAEWSSSSAEFIDHINERLLAAPQGEDQ